MRLFRAHSMEHEFTLANGAKFKQKVGIDTVVKSTDGRFGVDQNHIQRFIQSLKAVEIEGRKFRTKYRIPMVTGAPQAENFLWTILGNKVSVSLSSRNCVLYEQNTLGPAKWEPKFFGEESSKKCKYNLLFRKQKKQAIDSIISNQQRSIGKSSRKLRPKKMFWCKSFIWRTLRRYGNSSTRWRCQKSTTRHIKQKKTQ